MSRTKNVDNSRCLTLLPIAPGLLHIVTAAMLSPNKIGMVRGLILPPMCRVMLYTDKRLFVPLLAALISADVISSTLQPCSEDSQSTGPPPYLTTTPVRAHLD